MKKESLIEKIKGMSSSAKWTSLFAIIAVASILAIGLKPISFAAPTTMPDSFTTDPTTDPDKQIWPSGTELNYQILDYTANSGALKIYCLEWNKLLGVGADGAYTKNVTELGDPGLVYLLSVAPYENELSAYNLAKRQEEVWIHQLAIWVYYGEQVDTTTPYPSERLANFKQDGSGAKEWMVKVEALLQRAREIKTTYPNGLTEDINFNIDSSFRTTDDGLYMISKIMNVSVTPSEMFKDYSLNIKSAPAGTEILTTSGEVIPSENLVGLPANFEFQVKVPIKNITAETQTLVVEAVGNFKKFRAYQFAGSRSESQKVARAIEEPFTKAATLNLTLTPDIPVPDTASTTGKAIYFIGLIILLSGAGIIYANVKPKAKQK